MSENSVIQGVLHGYPQTRVILRSATLSDQTVSDKDGAFLFKALPAGQYRLSMPEVGIVRSLLELDGENQIRVEVDANKQVQVTYLSAEDQVSEQASSELSESSIRGRVSNGAGWTILLDGPTGEKSVVIDADGTYRFERLPSGDYTVRIPGTDAYRSGLEMDGSNHRIANFTLSTDQSLAQSIISGTVTNGAGFIIELQGPEGIQSVPVAPDETYTFERLPAGIYSLHIRETDARRSGLEMDGRNQRRANFKIVTEVLTESSIFGAVPGGAGLEVLLQGPGGLDMLVVLDETEQFGFTDLPAGSFMLIVLAPHGEVNEVVELDGANQVEVIIELPREITAARGYTIEDAGPGPGYGVVRVQIDEAPGLAVRIWSHGWQGMVRRIGDKPELGEFACEFAPLGGGTYFIQPEGEDVRAELQIDGSRVLWVRFERTGVAELAAQAMEALPKTTEHYLLIGALPADMPTLLALLRYVSRFQPTIGSAFAEALQARHVTILGSTLTVSAHNETRLIESGAQVDRVIPDNAVAVFQQYLDSDRPY